jgi:hypothetical protein
MAMDVMGNRSARAWAGILVAVLATLVGGATRANASRLREPHRIGPIVTVVSGLNWSLVAWRSDQGLCYSYGAPGAEGDGCGISLRKTIDVLEIGSVPSLTFRRNAGTLAIGVTSAAVADVTLRVSRRQNIARIYKPPPALRIRSRFFVVEGPRLPLCCRDRAHHPPWTFRAYDQRGRLVGRVSI